MNVDFFLSCSFTHFFLIRYNNILAESLEFSIYKTMSSTNGKSFTSSFMIMMPFIFFLVWLFQHRSGESGYPCLIPDLGQVYWCFTAGVASLTVWLGNVTRRSWKNLLEAFRQLSLNKDSSHKSFTSLGE